MPAGSLPPQGCCHQGGRVHDDTVEISLVSVRADQQQIRAQLDVFFIVVVGGCNCNDDPVGYPMCCRMQLRIDRATAESRLEALDRRPTIAPRTGSASPRSGALLIRLLRQLQEGLCRHGLAEEKALQRPAAV